MGDIAAPAVIINSALLRALGRVFVFTSRLFGGTTGPGSPHPDDPNTRLTSPAGDIGVQTLGGVVGVGVTVHPAVTNSSTGEQLQGRTTAYGYAGALRYDTAPAPHPPIPTRKHQYPFDVSVTALVVPDTARRC